MLKDQKNYSNNCYKKIINEEIDSEIQDSAHDRVNYTDDTYLELSTFI